MTLADRLASIDCLMTQLNQLHAARAIEELLNTAQPVLVIAWEICGNGSVRGRLALPAQTREQAINAVRAVHLTHKRRCTIVSRTGRGGGRELAARLPNKLLRIELWAYTEPPAGAPAQQTLPRATFNAPARPHP
ncbi:hypothetical protein [Streptomyces sp. Ac-502]|uniref:hypothetical protein n=1 Tax=Streptomyces sp. Ac-502 TaxID=3342801 RepID=UPI0038628BE5